ncbi:MAG: N-acetylglucosamine-6-phosphate deacetylase [Acidobacteria bacterium]|nr:N-acetylglucosamine-6-phosphate deacetylase [Acidobacteriota bacterium]
MIVLAGGDVVLPGRILPNAALLIDGTRITAIDPRAGVDPSGATIVQIPDCYVVPGFVDVHVHGVDGFDTLDEGDGLARIALGLPRYGVTAFCPTTVACTPAALRTMLAKVAKARAGRRTGSARVLPAHLESNFINPDYRGAQPLACLRRPDQTAGSAGEFSVRDVLDVIARARSDVGIVTLAPELPGSIELIRTLVAAGTRVSLGHSGATLDEAMAAIDAGACHATHLFNRMTPMTHREPGVAGAVLASDGVAAELICDGYHVHPAVSRIAVAAKGVDRMMAITDGTAGSGLPVGSRARLGGQPIRVTHEAVVLDDGTVAGSCLTMDRAFRVIATTFGLSVPDAATLCSTTPARELGLTGCGMIAEGAVADVVVLNRAFEVLRTFVDGEEVFRRGVAA